MRAARTPSCGAQFQSPLFSHLPMRHGCGTGFQSPMFLDVFRGRMRHGPPFLGHGPSVPPSGGAKKTVKLGSRRPTKRGIYLPLWLQVLCLCTPCTAKQNAAVPSSLRSAAAVPTQAAPRVRESAARFGGKLKCSWCGELRDRASGLCSDSRHKSGCTPGRREPRMGHSGEAAANMKANRDRQWGGEARRCAKKALKDKRFVTRARERVRRWCSHRPDTLSSAVPPIAAILVYVCGCRGRATLQVPGDMRAWDTIGTSRGCPGLLAELLVRLGPRAKVRQEIEAKVMVEMSFILPW